MTVSLLGNAIEGPVTVAWRAPGDDGRHGAGDLRGRHQRGALAETGPRLMLQLQPSPPSFVEVRRRFGFRSIEIGHWVTRAERNRAAEQFYQGLVDLMQTLRVPEAVISLRGQLGLQY